MAKSTVAEVEKRVTHLEGCQEHYDDTVNDIRKDIRALTKSNTEMREVVFNGLRDRVKNIEELLQKLAGGMPSTKKQRWMKMFTNRAIDAAVIGIVIVVIVFLVVGRGDIGQLIDLIRAVRGIG